jgi:sulfite reductase alpha subunit-like flavoprotein
MFANGAGVAPMRALIQEKIRSEFENLSCNLGTIALYFGTRTSSDFLFKGDYETAVKCGILKEFKVSFSRQQVRRIS